MACGLVSISTAEACDEPVGGIYKSYIAEYATLAFTVSGKKVTGLTGALLDYNYLLDKSPYYNAVGEKPTLRSHLLAQESFMKFSSNAAAADAADDVKSCCKLVLIHLFENGQVRFQGIQFTTAAKTALRVSTEECKATVSEYSDVSSGESRVEIKFNSKSTNIVVGDEATLTQAYLDALVA